METTVNFDSNRYAPPALGFRLEVPGSRPPNLAAPRSLTWRLWRANPSTSCGKSRRNAGIRRCCFQAARTPSCLLRLAEKAFRPARFPFPLLHIDTGHNFPEVIAFRDKRAAQLGERLIVRSVEDSIKQGRVVLKSAGESRNVHRRCRHDRLTLARELPRLTTTRYNPAVHGIQFAVQPART